MNKFIFFLLVVLCCSTAARAQTPSLQEFDAKRLKIQRNSMLVLGSWALGNFATNGILLLNGAEGTDKYFYQGNIYWNLVNFGLAGAGLFNAFRQHPANDLAWQTIKEQYNTEKVLLFNAGLDVAYLAGGMYLKERALNASDNRTQLEGWGNSLLLQGGFLLVFDVAAYLVHVNHRKKNSKLFKSLKLATNGPGIKLVF